jgi:hypothetical protein
MKGQWIGNFQGSVEGMLMVNIDEVEDHFEVVAHINPSDGNIPSSVAYISTGNNLPEQEADAFINPVDPRTGFQCKWDDIKELYGKGVSHSESAKVTLKIRDDKLHIDAVSDIGVTLSSVLVKPSEKTNLRFWEQKCHGMSLSATSLECQNRNIFLGDKKSRGGCGHHFIDTDAIA